MATATKSARPKSAQKQEADTKSQASPLSAFQEHFCELAGDLILHGGHDHDVEDLVTAVMCHDWRRRATWESPAKQAQSIAELMQQGYSAWLQKLSRNWPEKPLPTDQLTVEKQKQNSKQEQAASMLLRSRVRDELRDRFETFLTEATPEELRLMLDVFTTHDSISHGGEANEVALAEAFSYEIAERRVYIRVPDDYEKLVRQYLELLENANQQRSA